MANPTFRPVELCIQPPNAYRSIRTVRDAIQALLEHWSYEMQKGKPFERACKACLDAMENDGCAEKARWAFLRAAKAAGLAIRFNPKTCCDR